MAKKDLKYFMRSTEAEIVTAPGPKNFKDEEGNVIQFEIKKLTQEEITRINEAYRRRLTKKGIRLLQTERSFGKRRKTERERPGT